MTLMPMHSVRIGLFNIDFVPRTSWHRSIARLAQGSVWFGHKEISIPPAYQAVFNRIWQRIRRRELLRAGYRCEICGSSYRLHIHEVWEYDRRSRTQRLKGYRVLCAYCHRVHHSSYLVRRGDIDFLVDYIAEVNRSRGINIGRVVVSERLQKAYRIWVERSAYMWRINIDYERYLGRFLRLADVFLNYWIYVHMLNSLDHWLGFYEVAGNNPILLVIRRRHLLSSLKASPRFFVSDH